jgi:histone H3/H4
MSEEEFILSHKKSLINRLTMKRIAKKECQSIRKQYGIGQEYGLCVTDNYKKVKEEITKEVEDLAKKDIRNLKPLMVEVHLLEDS